MIMLTMLMFNVDLGLKISHLKNNVKIYIWLAGLAANISIPIVYIYRYNRDNAALV